MKKITVNVNDAKQTIKQHIEVTLDGAPTVIQAQNHVNYEFVDAATGKGPQHIIAKRVNNDLHVSFEENQDEADLIIEEYYSQEDSQLIGLGEDGRYHAYIADSNQAADATNHLLAGQIEGQYLPEDAGFIAPWWIGAGASGASSVLWPILGVLAGVGLIAGAASGGSSGGGSTLDTTPPAAPKTAPTLLDNVGSAQGVITSGQTTDDTQPSVAAPTLGTGETPVLYVDGNVVEHIVNDDGTLSPKEPLGEGTHTIGVGVKDAAGNVSGSSPTVSITVDTTAPAKPAAPASYNDNAGDVTGAESTAATTDDTTPGINVGKGLTDTPKLYDQAGNEIPATYDPVAGTLTPNNPLGEGEHQLSYTLTDAAGNESAKSDPIAFTVDTTAPAKPAAPASYTDNAGDVTGAESTAATTDDTTPGINVGKGLTDTPKLYDQAGNEIPATYDAATGTLTPNNPLGEGEHQLSYTLTDAAGNESAKSDPIVFAVDATAPDAPIVNPSNGKIVSGTAEPGGTVTVTLLDNSTKEVPVGEDGKWSVTLDTPLTDGQEVKVTASDAAGNTSAPTPVIVDASPPNSPTLVAKEGGVTVTPAVDTDKVVVKYTDDSGAEKEVVANKDTEGNWTLADGTLAGVTIDATTGAISFPAAQIDATQGATAVGSDNAGNNSEPGVLPADATPPNAPVLTEVGSGADVGALKVAFDKAGSDKVVVSYKDDAGADVALVATKDASGNWSLVDAPTGVTIDSTAGLISIPANQINPLQGAKAVASDNAGNTSEAKLPTTGTLSLDSFTDTGIGDDHISYDHIFSVKHEGVQADTTVTYQVSTDGGTNWTTVTLKDGQPDYSAYQSPVFVYRATDASRFTLDIGSDGTATPNIIVEKGADGVWKLAEGSKILPGGAQINPATGAVSIPQDALPLNADGTPKVTATGASLDPATITAWNQGDYQFRVEVKDAAGNLAYTTIEKATIEPSTPSPKVYMDVSLEAYIGDLFIEPGRVSDDGKEEVAAGTDMLDGSTMVLSYTLTATNTPTTLTLTKVDGVWTPSSTLPAGFTLDAATGKVAIESGTLVQGSPVTVTENNINGKSSSETNRAPVLANGALNDT